MLEPTDAILLPPGVRLEGDQVADDVRGARYPANAAARLVLALPGVPLADVARRLDERWRIGPERARADTLAFAWALNRALLVNVDRSGGRLGQARAWAALALRLAPTGALPPAVARRQPLETRTPLAAARSALGAVRARALGLGAVAASLAAQLGLVAGRPDVRVPLLVGLATAAGVAAHEAGHAVGLAGEPAALVTAGRRVFVLHRRLRGPRRLVVALAGPAAPSLAGVAAAGLAQSLASPALALAACPLAAHALCATVAGRDGRIACNL
jgi:hypothetical protein